MDKTTNVCAICKKSFQGEGNNPHPVVKSNEAVCCDACNLYVVMPARLKELHENNRRVMPDEV